MHWKVGGGVNTVKTLNFEKGNKRIHTPILFLKYLGCSKQLCFSPDFVIPWSLGQ